MAEMIVYENSKELERLENIVCKNIRSFYECGKALSEIRDKKLYCDVAGYETFEQYCKDKWDFGRNYAYKLIGSYEAVENIKSNLCTIVHIEPSTESQVRPLTKLEPQKQIEAWKEVCERSDGKPITAAIVSQVVKKMNGNCNKQSTIASNGEDPPRLFNLKRLWTSASKKEQALFLKWIENLEKE